MTHATGEIESMPARPNSLQPFRLPNGCTVTQLNAAETSLQYRNIFTDKRYQQHILTLNPGDVVLDVGANVGIASLYFHWTTPGVRVYAFEPTQPLYDALRDNFARHNVPGAAYHCALSDRNGVASITVYPNASAMSSLYADAEHDGEVTRTFLANSGFTPEDIGDMTRGLHAKEEQECQLRTLSEWCEEHCVERIALLKINVEKAERDVLAGIAEGQWPGIRQLVMQVHDEDGGVQAVRRELLDRGFRVFVEQDPLLVGTDIYELVAVGDGER